MELQRTRIQHFEVGLYRFQTSGSGRTKGRRISSGTDVVAR